MVYRAPVQDMLFTMTHAAGLTPTLYPDLADGGAESILDEAAKMAEGALAPLFRIGDTAGAQFENGVVRTAPGWPEAYAQWIAGGWMGVTADEAHGGLGLPHLLNAACLEMWNGANMAFALAPLLSLGAIEALAAHGSDDLRTHYLPRIVSGEWSATMNLTEPQAGSDLSALRAKAERREDGSYGISGEKIYITYGEHDMTDNIVHLVLARLPDAPAGTRGISLFLVPKMLRDGVRNSVRCTGLEHKMGIHGSPTCTMLYEDATGWLIGEENRGLACMFTMMNNARLAVGLQGVGVAERAAQTALAFARDRRQGHEPGDDAPMSAIVRHPDVKRMLLTMQATTAAARAICYMTAQSIDLSHRGDTDDIRHAARERAGLLTPVAKAYGSDVANDCASLCVQTHGGMGFIEETGAAQMMRDARIAAIYEGTNGIQAIDLVQRKLTLLKGAAMRHEIARLRATVERIDPAIQPHLAAAVNALETSAEWLMTRDGEDLAAALAGATPFLRLFALTLGGVALAEMAEAAGGQGRWRTLAHFFATDIASLAPALARGLEDSAAIIVGADSMLEDLPSDIEVTQAEGVLTIELTRAQKRNALTAAMYETMIEAFATAGRDETIGAIVIRGGSGVFTAGNDIADFIAAAQKPGDMAAMRFVEALAMLDMPLVAAIEGAAVGVGATLTLHCDLVYAAPGAQFRMPFVDLGLVPEAGSSLLLPQRVGMARASEILLLGEAFNAEDAHRLGLVNAIVAPDALYDHAQARAAALAAKPRAALAATRRLLRGDREALRAQMQREGQAFAQALKSGEAQKAFMAFMSRSKGL